MDNDTNNTARSALRQPFIETANALASLYKQAATAERDAKDAGAASAYRTIMQWAATKSTSGEQISPADVISLCATELSRIRRSASSHPPDRPDRPDRTERPERPLQLSPNNIEQSPRTPDPPQQPDVTPPVSYIPRDEALVSDIRKLNVNPRKRQRVDISDTFIRACRNNEAFIFAKENPYVHDSMEENSSPFRLQSDSNDTPSSRREANRENFLFSSPHTEFNASRKTKNVKAQLYDKLRKK